MPEAKTNEDQQVVEMVTNEIKKLGDNTKQNFEDMNVMYKKLQGELDNIKDQSDKNKVDKIATEISVRQEELDKKTTDIKEAIESKIEQLELAIKRPGGVIASEDVKEMKEYRDWVVSNLSARDKGTSPIDVERNSVSYDDFKLYEKTFETLMRYGKDRINFTDAEKKVLSEGVDPHGGYTVTPAMSNRIIQKIYETDPIRQLATVESITTAELEFMVDVDEAGYGWEGETQSGAETDTADLGVKKIVVGTMYAKPKATRNLLEDSGINIQTWLANKVADRFSRVEAAAFVTGNGISKPRGFLTYDSGTTHKTVEQVNMGHASLLTADGFIKVKYSLVEDYLGVGTWLMNRTTVRDTMLLKYGDGQYIWKPGLTTDAQSTILGLPVRMSTTMPAVATNALSVVLADFSNAYTIVDRLGITVEPDPYTKKPFIEFYTRKRVGGGVVNGQAIKIGKISA